MTRPIKHTRIPDLPFIHSLQGARLRSFGEEINGKRHEFILDYDALRLDALPELVSENGGIFERVRGSYEPARLRFSGVRTMLRDGLFADLDALPLDHPARSLRGALCWVSRDSRDLFTLFSHGAQEPARLWVYARGCVAEPRPGAPEPVEFLRDWSPPPPFRPGLVPDLLALRAKYGGDPVTVRIGARTYHQRLFVGGIEYQCEQRPRVDAVLNVGEEPSVWSKNGPIPPSDRAFTRGEGSQGMRLDELTEEAGWVIERLRRGQRVLVHCVAGLNRSTSICCAVLILLEGLSAEAALDRVRDHHAWARPDEHHWLMLKWLAKTRSSHPA